MRLSHKYIEKIALVAGSAEDLITALGNSCSPEEKAEIQRLVDAGLPPVTSSDALSVMTGFNPGFIWSLVSRPEKQYRVFKIPKGREERQIEAPRVALKLIQKWFSVHFENKWVAHSSVHGFVRGRSHISAAKSHLGAEWVASVDIRNFFPSTTASEVDNALRDLGYGDESIKLLKRLCCFGGRLSQGAPTSPILSNIALHRIDLDASNVAIELGAVYTRYADDIVFSGKGLPPPDVLEKLEKLFTGTCWQLSERKRHIAQLPGRLKVHGLLVHGDKVRLTKGYRNRVRAYKHLVSKGRINLDDRNRIGGHINYAKQIDEASD
ncbi:reverse transcriptase family protein [Labrenzia sp. PHM005]|uniref:reverse transcriptase family protein n=1 Tax=Labrenzia sp. PHM005 TaxID=2590016 RepID=UPI00114074EF|nr:reverse transcriptase family protein [Labrenzia sp. PHM005]QDG74464.1 hypothetical protein FJ695_00440 [Labrenzia sp. PHM005]